MLFTVLVLLVVLVVFTCFDCSEIFFSDAFIPLTLECVLLKSIGLYFFLLTKLHQKSKIKHCLAFIAWIKNMYVFVYIFTNPSAQAGCDTRSIFKRILTGLNSESSFSLTCWHTKVKEPSLLFTHIWMENSWNHKFPKSISTMWNANPDFELGSPFPFPIMLVTNASMYMFVYICVDR